MGGRFFEEKQYEYTVVCIDIRAILAVVKRKHPPGVAGRFWARLQRCWPALKGSLALVHKPCIRPHCRACARGQKHPNYLLTFTDQGRRRCLYVPTPMVARLKRALGNGRRIEQLLYKMGPALLAEYRAAHPAQTGPAVALRRPRTRKPHANPSDIGLKPAATRRNRGVARGNSSLAPTAGYTPPRPPCPAG